MLRSLQIAVGDELFAGTEFPVEVTAMGGAPEEALVLSLDVPPPLSTPGEPAPWGPESTETAYPGSGTPGRGDFTVRIDTPGLYYLRAKAPPPSRYHPTVRSPIEIRPAPQDDE